MRAASSVVIGILQTTPRSCGVLSGTKIYATAPKERATGRGLLLGSALGRTHWLALRHHMARAEPRLPANAVARALVMVMVFAGSPSWPLAASDSAPSRTSRWSSRRPARR